jgi:hypothetical protein
LLLHPSPISHLKVGWGQAATMFLQYGMSLPPAKLPEGFLALMMKQNTQ